MALAFLSVLILIRLLLPNVCVVLGLIHVSNGFTGGPEDANCYWPSRITDDLHQEMLALGFQPLGTYWEQLPFTRRFEEFVFTRPGENCFGLLYPNDQIAPRRGSFLTVFETGGVVFSKNYSGGVEARESDVLATGAGTAIEPALPQPSTGSFWSALAVSLAAGLFTALLVRGADLWPGSNPGILPFVPGAVVAIAALLVLRPRVAVPATPEREPLDIDVRTPLVETLARHRLNVSLMLAAGQRTPIKFDAEEFIATQQRYHRHPAIRRRFQAAMLTLLLGKLFVLAIVPGIFFLRAGFGDPLPWSVLLAEGLAGLYLRYGCSSATVVNVLRGCAGNQKAS
jgi:hypothetical protein